MALYAFYLAYALQFYPGVAQASATTVSSNRCSSAAAGWRAIVGWERVNTAENSHTTQGHPPPIGPQGQTS